ncbi:MAG TPA: hypothetical protein VGM39_03240 [Kofleriaceae bacterium]
MWRVFLLTSFLVACADLPEVPAGTCGNLVVEAGEDCDSVPDPAYDEMHTKKLACDQCAYTCDPGAPATTCPDGWGCGVDRRCRRGTGGFEQAASPPASFPHVSLVAGDRDGDTAADIVGGGDGHVGTLTAVNRQLAVDITSTFGAETLVGADLDGDGISEILWPSLRGGIQGSRGVHGGNAQPMLALGSLDIDQTTPGIQPAPPGTQIISVHLDDGTVVPYALMPATTGLAWIDLSKTVRGAPNVTAIQGSPGKMVVAIGNIDGAPGDEIAIGFVGASTIYPRHSDMSPMQPIALPQPLAGAPIFGLIDADATIDLLAPVQGPSGAIAKGTGTTLATVAVDDSRFSTPVPPACGTGTSPTAGALPKLAADLDGDGITDYVTREGIAHGTAGGRFCTAFGVSSNVSMSTTELVATLDANGDGRTDVAFASGIDTRITLVINKATGFEGHSIVVSHAPTELRPGSFDWDTYDDLLVVETAADGPSHLEIAKGTNVAASQVVLAGPDAPALSTIAAGAFGGDDVDDLVMLGTEPGREAPYYAQVALVGEGTDFFSQLGGPATGRVTRLLIGAVDGGTKRDDVVVMFADMTRNSTRVWVYPDQTSYLTDRDAREALSFDGTTAPPAALADLDGDTSDELVIATAQGLAIYDLQTVDAAPLVVSVPLATAITTVRRPGGDCLLLTSETAGATLACGLHDLPTFDSLTTEAVYGALATDLDADRNPEAILVGASTFATYDLETQTLREKFDRPASLAVPVATCTGDFDGDGVDDLAVGGDDSIELWWGIPREGTP